MIQVTLEFKDVETAVEALSRLRDQVKTASIAAAVLNVPKENTKPPKPVKAELSADTKPTATAETAGAPETVEVEPVVSLAELAVFITKAALKNKPALLEILNAFPHKDDATKVAGKGSNLLDADRVKVAARLRELLL